MRYRASWRRSASSRWLEATFTALISFPIACFTLALLTDLAYWQTSVLIWTEFSAWLLLAGIVFGVLAAIVGALLFFMVPEWRTSNAAGLQAAGGFAVLIAAFLNNLVHAADGWTSVVPWGLVLSCVTVAAMLITAVLGLARPDDAGVSYDDREEQLTS